MKLREGGWGGEGLISESSLKSSRGFTDYCNERKDKKMQVLQQRGRTGSNMGQNGPINRKNNN